MVVYDERGQSTSSAVLKPPMENGRFIKILQEIRQEIEDEAWSMKCIDDDMYELEDKAVDLDDALRIIDSHISDIKEVQFERIWNHTVEEMKRRKICEDILEEAEEYDSETMSGSLLTDDDLRLLINDAMDNVTQWIKDNTDFIKEMARMLEENDRRIQG